MESQPDKKKSIDSDTESMKDSVASNNEKQMPPISASSFSSNTTMQLQRVMMMQQMAKKNGLIKSQVKGKSQFMCGGKIYHNSQAFCLQLTNATSSKSLLAKEHME